MGELERMVIFPETRSGRMKLRWVNWLTNWITSARSRLSKLTTTVLALLWMSFLSTGAVAGGSVVRGAPGPAAGTGVCGAMAFLYGGAVGAGRFTGMGPTGFTRLPGVPGSTSASTPGCPGTL